MLPSESGERSQKRRTPFPRGFASCTVVITAFILFVICSFYFYADIFRPSRSAFSRLNRTLTHVKNAFNFSPARTRQLSSETQRTALVLLWTSYFSETGRWLPQPSRFRCPVSDCHITDNRDLLNTSDAVIFHWRSVNMEDLPRWRHHHQRWVLFNKEAPPNTPSHILKALAWRTNWTVTYRKDSDIYAPYGYIRPKAHSVSISIPSSHRKPVCWLVSNCHTSSAREEFVEQMKNFISVEVYGSCGVHKCPVSDRLECYRALSKMYKFYLSFENSICKDYATEKLYYALISGMVPVVMGGENYRDVLPPNSYIDALSFEGPEELAKYLLYLDKNDDKYMPFLAWRQDYEVIDGSYRWVCELCKMLHENVTKTHGSLSKWWYEDAKCSTWKELTNSIFS